MSLALLVRVPAVEDIGCVTVGDCGECYNSSWQVMGDGLSH